MEEQKKNVIEFVRLQKSQGQSITESLKELGIRRSTYYTWLNSKQKKQAPSRAKLTPVNNRQLKKKTLPAPAPPADPGDAAKSRRICLLQFGLPSLKIDWPG